MTTTLEQTPVDGTRPGPGPGGAVLVAGWRLDGGRLRCGWRLAPVRPPGFASQAPPAGGARAPLAPRAPWGVREALALLGVAAGLVLAVLAPSAVAQASGDRVPAVPVPALPADVPAALHVPEGHALLFRSFAQGTQVYDCRADGTGWAFRQPLATLLDEDGAVLGIHGRGPFWAAYDGSRVAGAAQANAPARAPGEDIPHLLLRATAADGDGRFAPVTFIQRLDTRGGVAPAGPCDPQREPSVAVPYLAVYYFYGARATT